MRPVLRGLCKYESLKDGLLDLADVALMNDALNVQEDNQALMREYLEKHNDGSS